MSVPFAPFFEAGDCDKLLSLYEQTLKLRLSDLDKGRIYYERAESFQLENKREEAVSSFSDAIQILKDHVNTWEALYIICISYYNLYLQCLDNDQLKYYSANAIKYFELATKKYPEHTELHYLCTAIADLYMRNNDYDKALHYYNFALNKNKDATGIVQCLCGIAAIYIQVQEFEKALQYFQEALDSAKKNSISTGKIFFDIGAAYFSMDFCKDSLAKAEDAFKKSLKQKENDLLLKNNIEFEVQILWYLGRIAYETARESRDIEKYFGRVLELIDDKNHPFYSVRIFLWDIFVQYRTRI